MENASQGWRAALGGRGTAPGGWRADPGKYPGAIERRTALVELRTVPVLSPTQREWRDTAMATGRWMGEGSVATSVLATPAACRRVRVSTQRTPTLCSESFRRRWPPALRREGRTLCSTGGPHDELLVLEQPPARFDPVLGRVLNASRSTEGFSCRSPTEPMSMRTERPTEGWGGVAPSRPFTCCR